MGLPGGLQRPVHAPAAGQCLGRQARCQRRDEPGRLARSGQPALLQLRQKYAPKTQLGNFGQLGFTAARIAVQALLSIKSGDYTTATAGAAFKGVKDYRSDLYCKPWYFGTPAFHTANNTTRTITPQSGQWTQAQDCSEIPALPNNNFAKIRAYEKQIGLG
jgi:branched-chain amino acid transport system substrate-binding protein